MFSSVLVGSSVVTFCEVMTVTSSCPILFVSSYISSAIAVFLLLFLFTRETAAGCELLNCNGGWVFLLFLSTLLGGG